MKKLLAIMLVFLMTAVVLTGCDGNGQNNATPDLEQVQQPVASEAPQQQSAVHESQTEPTHQPNNVEKDIPPPPSEPVQPKETQKPDNMNSQNFIGENAAKDIALKKAGTTADGVIFDRVELDFDDGVWQYEIEFRQNRVEYDVDVKADDGKVLSFERDYD